jgi:hypothetical protein
MIAPTKGGLMSENALYYTLSTVSQTLAGALGMLAAFLAIRVASLDATIQTDLEGLKRETGESYWPSLSGARDIAGIIEAWDTHIKGMPGLQTEARMSLLNRARSTLVLKTDLLEGAQRAFILSAIIMGVCFAGLAVTPWLGVVAERGETAGGLAVLCGVTCLVWYGRIVRAALK